MEPIAALFDRMDSWRHFPNYQLERRADIFFSLYLPEVLEVKLGFPMARELAPEFPVRIGTIYPEIPIDKSYKIDYLAQSSDGYRAIFVELKTDGLSRRIEQDKYLFQSQRVGLASLLEGVLDIFRATNSKPKYFCLLLHLEKMGLLELPAVMKTIMRGRDLHGIVEASREVKITASATNCQTVYIQPNGDGAQVISFEVFADVVASHGDFMSLRFAKSLREWAAVRAGATWRDRAQFDAG